MQRTDGLWYWAEYSTFNISDEAGNYQLTVDGYSGDASNALMITTRERYAANGRMFTTTDNDNDSASGNCASTSGGWWLGRCSTSRLNSDANTTVWKSLAAVPKVLHSRMLLKVD